ASSTEVDAVPGVGDSVRDEIVVGRPVAQPDPGAGPVADVVLRHQHVRRRVEVDACGKALYVVQGNRGARVVRGGQRHVRQPYAVEAKPERVRLDPADAANLMNRAQVDSMNAVGVEREPGVLGDDAFALASVRVASRAV